MIVNKNKYIVLLYSPDKEKAVRSAFALSDADGELFRIQDFNKILRQVESLSPALILIDIDHTSQKPLKLIQTLSSSFKQITLVAITTRNPLNTVVQAVRYGVRDVLNLNTDMLKLQKEISYHYQDWHERDQSYLTRQRKEYDFRNIIGQSQPIQQVFNLISKIVKRKWVTVLIYGETGTGKELIARTIHYQTCQDDEQFVEINCSALPETLLESELFGYEKGAFTDAKSSKKGLFELADKGTLFLDEIGEISPKMQVKLLRVLEDKKIRRVGGIQDIRVNTRIITATNRDLRAAIREGKFRSDLFYRLNVIHIYVPPLRERGEDILKLADYYLEYFVKEYNSPVQSFSKEAQDFMCQYYWPGNVRELKHSIERIVLLSDDKIISRRSMEQTIQSETPIEMSVKSTTDYLQLEIPPEGITLEEAEKSIIDMLLRKTGWNKRRTCRILQISRPRLDRKIEKFKLDPDRKMNTE